MLDLGGYLLGVLQIGLLVGSSWLGASAARSRLLPGVVGAPAHLATAVLALALLIWAGELLGSLGLFGRIPYLLAVAVGGFGMWAYLRGWRRLRGPEDNSARRAPSPDDRTRGRNARVPAPSAGTAIAVVALLIAAIAVVGFGDEVRVRLGTGMTGFDSTWYHGPFAAGFLQSGDTWDLHFIAPQFLAWFYPANSELLHGVGMLALDRDVLSLLLNLGWFVGCLVACWCIGRPYRVAPWSLALGAIALSVPAFADQAGEARNDIVGAFFLLAAVAVAVNAWGLRADGERGLANGALAVVGLAAGLAAGTKLNFLLPAGVLVLGLAVIAPPGQKLRAFAASSLAALAGGGYWYLRNLAHAGNPLPWVKDLGPISLPAPEQALGGREGHSVLGYLLDGSVWSDWLLPGLHDGLWVVWPLLLAVSLLGLLLCLGRGASPLLRVVGVAGLAAAFAWLIAPTSASGPDGMPRGFESGLRYLVPALVLGVALLPATPPLGKRLAQLSSPRSLSGPDGETIGQRTAPMAPGKFVWGLGLALAALVVAIGYPVQRHYLEGRYADPSFTTPGLNAAFEWARSLSDARVATTSTRQYPLFGTDLSNRVEFIGTERPHGGFVAPATCRTWRHLIDEGDYDFVIASRDRIEPGQAPYPPTARWTEGPSADVVLREPPTVVFRLSGSLDPADCP